MDEVLRGSLQSGLDEEVSEDLVPYLARALDSAVRPLLRSAEGNETYAGPDILHAAVVLRGVAEFLAAEAP